MILLSFIIIIKYLQNYRILCEQPNFYSFSHQPRPSMRVALSGAQECLCIVRVAHFFSPEEHCLNFNKQFRSLNHCRCFREFAKKNSRARKYAILERVGRKMRNRQINSHLRRTGLKTLNFQFVKAQLLVSKSYAFGRQEVCFCIAKRYLLECEKWSFGVKNGKNHPLKRSFWVRIYNSKRKIQSICTICKGAKIWPFAQETVRISQAREFRSLEFRTKSLELRVESLESVQSSKFKVQTILSTLIFN